MFFYLLVWLWCALLCKGIYYRYWPVVCSGFREKRGFKACFGDCRGGFGW